MGRVAGDRAVASRVGIQIGASTPPAELAGIAAEAERLGFAEIWLAEDYFELGGIASVATALAATQRVPIGLGIVAAVARHPAVTAMEFATLAGAFPGRFIGGLGHGAPEWVRQMGLEPASVLRSMREATTALRRLLAGEDLTEAGEYFSFDRVRLRHPPREPVPLYYGVHGPRSLRLSGELADGTLLGWFTSPEYVAWARERIDEGRERAGRSDHHVLVALCILSIDDADPAAARRTMAGWVGRQVAGMADSPAMLATEPGRSLAARVAEEGEAAVSAGLPGALLDALLDAFVAAGDAAACAAMMRRLLDAGADRVVLVPNPAGIRSTAAMVDQMRVAASLMAMV